MVRVFETAPALSDLYSKGVFDQLQNISSSINYTHKKTNLSGFQANAGLAVSYFIARWFNLDAGIQLHYFAASLDDYLWKTSQKSFNTFGPTFNFGVHFLIANKK